MSRRAASAGSPPMKPVLVGLAAATLERSRICAAPPQSNRLERAKRFRGLSLGNRAAGGRAPGWQTEGNTATLGGGLVDRAALAR